MGVKERPFYRFWIGPTVDIILLLLQSFDSSAFCSLPCRLLLLRTSSLGWGFEIVICAWGSSVGRFDWTFLKFPCVDFRMKGLKALPLALPVQNLIKDRSGKLGRHVQLDVAEIVLQARILPVQFIVRMFMIGAENSQLSLNF
jgi:hypothetical protein